MTHIPDELRDATIERAAGRCEYCTLSQAGQEATFHVDHITPQSANGPTELNNLALACVSCSLRKAARQSAVDPDTGVDASLFNPRMQTWTEHFRFEGAQLIGRTASGRATIAALQLNRPLILAIRAEEKLLGRHPPK